MLPGENVLDELGEGGGGASTFHLFNLFFVRFTPFKGQAAVKGSIV